MYNDPDLPHIRADNDDAALDGETAETGGMTPRFGRLALCVAAASALSFGVVGTVAYGVWFNSDQQTYAEAIARARQALRMPAPNSTAAVLAKSSEGTSGPLAMSADVAPPSMAPPSLVTPPVVTPSVAPPSVMPPSVMSPSVTPPAVAAATAPLVTAAMGAPARGAGVAPGTPADAIALLDLPAIPDQASAPVADESRKPSTWAGQIKRPQEEVLADNAADAPSTLAAPAISPRAMQASANTPEAPAPQFASTRPAREARYAQQERRASATSPRRKGNIFAKMGSFFRRVSYRQHGSGSQQDLYSHP